MKIAITGGSGFVGRWLCEAIARDGDEPVVLGRHPRLERAGSGAVEWRYEPTDYAVESLARLFEPCGAVVHLAAARFGDNSRFDLYHQNVETSWRVFEAAQRVRLPRVVAISSASVYSERNPQPWTEDCRAVPQGLYGASKLAMESLADVWSLAQGLNVVCLRVAQVLGHGEHGGYMLNTFIERAHAGLELMVQGEGHERREYVYVKDVAQAILATLKSNAASGVYNVGPGIQVSRADLARTIARVFQSRGGVRFQPVEHERCEHRLMDVRKAREDLGWQAQWSLEAALEDIREHMSCRDRTDGSEPE